MYFPYNFKMFLELIPFYEFIFPFRPLKKVMIYSVQLALSFIFSFDQINSL